MTDFESEAVERWFVRRGVPQAIHAYNAREDVLTRMVPMLVLVFLFGAMFAFGDRFEGWDQAYIVTLSLLGLLAIAISVNKLRGRRLLALPQNVEAPELAVYLLGAPALSLLLGSHGLTGAFWILIANFAILLALYFLTLYALFSMLVWGLREVLVQLRGVFQLFTRMLPFLMLFATFLFINAEMWQVANDMSEHTFWVVMSMVSLPVLFPLAFNSTSGVEALHSFKSWKAIDEIASQTSAPLSAAPKRVGKKVELVPLGKGERVNFAMLVLVTQIVQVLMVGALVTLFFVVFGLFAIREETILQWVVYKKGEFDPWFDVMFFDTKLIVTDELFRVAAFIGAISALQFSVSVVNDDVYRQQFNASLEAEIREVLAVRARYLEHRLAQPTAESNSAHLNT